MADVFLSYARTNLAAAQRIAALLRAQGFTVWYDESLPAHRAFGDVIEEQLEAARAVLVLWSAEAAASQWVRSEANRGRERHCLIQVRLDDARLPMPFDQLQCVDLRRWDGEPDAAAWSSVVASVAELAGREPAVAPPPSALAMRSPASRRQVLLAGGAVAGIAAAAGATAWLMRDGDEVSPEAQILIQKGMDALQQNDALETQEPGSTLTAIALLSEATQAAPDSATAWGALAMAYAVRRRVVPLAERPGLDDRARAAARTALELDRKEGRAAGALRMLEPPYRNWIIAERGHRAALENNPTFPILLFLLSDLLGNVGRWREARSYSDRFDRKRFLLPGADRKVIINQWAAGDLPAADRMLDLAVKQWPQHPQIFRTRLAYLMFTGRPSEALEILRRKADWPVEIRPDFIAAISATAEALAGQRPAAEATRAALDYAAGNASSVLQVAQACVALGDPNAAFALLRGYYFGEGEWRAAAPLGGDQDRITSPLFQPMMRPIWRERDFDALLERIGLNEYWRRSRTVPDFRR